MDVSDDLFEALASEQRRRLLVELLGSEAVHVKSLSRVPPEMAAAHERLVREYLSRDPDLPDGAAELLRLHRVHLPHLVECDFVEWRCEDRVVTRGARFEELEPFLEVLDRPAVERVEPAAPDRVRR